jgi:HPt (histidine-containing phosphotransfer) domain-containing protein
LVNSPPGVDVNPSARKEVKVPAILLDLIPQYLINRRLELEALEIALAEKDYDSIQSTGHKLKGNAGSYGFYDLTELGSTLEKAGKEKDLELASTSIHDYREYIENVYILPA